MTVLELLPIRVYEYITFKQKLVFRRYCENQSNLSEVYWNYKFTAKLCILLNNNDSYSLKIYHKLLF